MFVELVIFVVIILLFVGIAKQVVFSVELIKVSLLGGSKLLTSVVPANLFESHKWLSSSVTVGSSLLFDKILAGSHDHTSSTATWSPLVKDLTASLLTPIDIFRADFRQNILF